MDKLPNLAGVATAELVEKIGGGNFSASYINWSRTVNLLREHAPGWHAELVPTQDGAILHRAPQGAFMLIRFRNGDQCTPPVPQAVMDSRNNAIAFDKITARDITDTHRRGVCMAAAFTFGLAYELWAKIPLESGYHEAEQPEAKVSTINAKPTDGCWDGITDARRQAIEDMADIVKEYASEQDYAGANDYLRRAEIKDESSGELRPLEDNEKVALWTLLDSKTRSALKKANMEKAA